MDRHRNLLQRESSLLLVVDMQAVFAETIAGWENVCRSVELLVHAAKTLQVPVIATTQNAAKLGGLTPEVAAALGNVRLHDKLTFSCAQDPFASEAIRHPRRSQIVICGVETHICIAQTALDLAASGYRVTVPADAVSSSTVERHKLGMERLRDSEILPASAEAVVYEWLGAAGTAEFRTMLPLLKENSA